MRGKKNMHREIQIKQFPIVTTHWWPKTQNERFVWENEQYLYRFLPLVHNHVQVKWVRTHIRCVMCVCARSGSRLTEGVSEAWCWGNCHRSCRFWTVYSRIMRTYFKQTRLLSSLYLYTSAPCIRFIHLEPGTVYWDMTPTRKKKEILLWRSAPCIRFIHLYLGVNAWRRACLKRGALKNIWIVWQYYYIRLCIFLLVQNDGSLISEWHKYYSWTNPSS